MQITINQVSNILNTLPIGYYCGRNFDVKLDSTGNTSYFDEHNDTIIISYSNIDDAAKQLPDVGNIEGVIRTLLYHELSHTILSPSAAKVTRCSYIYNIPFDVVNIFEDERIETILRDYYHNVNFRNLVYLLNGKTFTVNNAIDYFFRLVRYRIGDAGLLARVENIINTFNNYIDDDTCNNYICNHLVPLWYDVQKMFNSNEQQQKSQNNQQTSQQNSSNNQQSGMNQQNSNSQNNNSTQSNNNQNGNTQESSGNQENDGGGASENKPGEHNVVPTIGQEEDMSAEYEAALNELNSNSDSFEGNHGGASGKFVETKKLIEKVLLRHDAQYAEKYYKYIKPIIADSKSKVKRMSAAIPAYSGKINPRNITRNDYKLFDRDNRLGSNQNVVNGKIHFNLFIDNSGSFIRDVPYVNSLLLALNRLEKEYKKFTYDVIRCGAGSVVCEKNKRFVDADDESTYLVKTTITEIFTRLNNRKDTQVYNFVLYDGMCYLFDNEYNRRYINTGFTFYDTKNTTIIIEDENLNNVKNLTKAKVIVTDDYTRTFIDKILERLEILLNF